MNSKGISRGENMRRIRGKNTGPELAVRGLLRALGFTGYRLHRKDLPGRPDVAFIGEAEKSHQKARQRGFTECWTVVNVGRLDMVKARSESPSTDRFYSLAALSLRAGDEYDDFRRRVLSLTAIPAAPTNP
ncbi:XcyI family restriction endonuclease [Escherichia coli]|uniref:XcyI family restriction endonuclease n=1 Tax=Escherichia coli TaxID=562 RepID=UPI001365BEA4|nr:XcyI family restriction endonuclease [Escherichia coli]MWF56864.1 XcyI family restriction endonuclease [Escherichia coli]